MKSIIKNYLESYYEIKISDDTVEKFYNILEHKKFSKGHVVVPSGEPTSKFYILLDGIVGSFVKNNENRSYIRTLYIKGRAFGALSSLIQKNIVSNASYNCLTNCEVLEGNYNDFLQLRLENKEFEIIYGRVLEETYIRTEKKMDDFCSLNAKERFVKLTKSVPDICNLLPQYQIANYLNITPVQLSRIRKQLLSE